MDELNKEFYIAICDDEEIFLQREYMLISKYMSEKAYPYEIETYASGKELLESCGDISKYNIVFLDVNMDGLDGIETAKIIRKLTNEVYLVFVTAYISHALDGYKVDAVRYILKDDDCLEKTIYECLNAVVSKIKVKECKQIFNFQEGMLDINLESIIYIESLLHKLIFHVNGQGMHKYTMYERLDVIDELISSHGFCRIHKSYLVNMKYVKSIERYKLKLVEGTILNIAKPRFPGVKEKYVAYKGDL